MLELSRRALLRTTACGFGGLALQGLLAHRSLADSPLPAGAPHDTPRAQRVIFLYMSGGPSQIDLFDPKPLIDQKHGTRISPPIDGREVTVGVDRYLALGSKWQATPRGAWA
jgi:hypothetical protein